MINLEEYVKIFTFMKEKYINFWLLVIFMTNKIQCLLVFDELQNLMIVDDDGC